MRSLISISLLTTLLFLSACFPTEVWNPVFTLKQEDVLLPANGIELKIPFTFDCYTKTSRPTEIRQFKCKVSIDENEIEYGVNDVFWQWNWWNGHSLPDALLYISIPKNNSGRIVDIEVFVAVDDLYNRFFEEEDGDVHQWGEWQIVFSGQQDYLR